MTTKESIKTRDIEIPKEGFLRREQVEAVTGFKKTYLYRKIKEGSFPAPKKFGVQSSRWDVNEVRAWVEAHREGRA